MDEIEINSRKKLRSIICCPICYNELLDLNNLYCGYCNRHFKIIGDIPLFVEDKSLLESIKQRTGEKQTWKKRLKTKIPIPDERLWTSQAKKSITSILEKINPDLEKSIVVNMGSGTELFFKNIFSKFESIVRIGIPHEGEVDAYADAMMLPIKNGSIDLFISSSVIEHLPDPEKAVSELFRTIKPGGYVYAEIPFIGAYHMAPHDYQRYTVSGIEVLFKRHGFVLVEKGICSGPVTALVLLFQHAIVEAIPWGSIQYVVRLLLTWILYPLKYLDKIFSRTTWAEYFACNFFFLGRKPS